MWRTVRSLLGVSLVAGSVVWLGTGPAGGVPGANHPRLRIDVVVSSADGYPTGSLQVRRTCTPAGNATTEDSALFTTTTADLMTGTGSFLSSPQSCTVSVLQSGGMTATFACATANQTLITCTGNDSVTWGQDSAVEPAARTATVTVTFERPAPAPEPEPTTTTTTTAAAAVVVQPNFPG